VTVRDAWEAEAANWVAWARAPGHDSYWTFHRDRFLQILPCAGGQTLDVGCGEGRLPRDLKRLGYEVIGVDASATLIAHAQDAGPDGDYRIADAAALPVEGGSMSLVTAFMSLHDVDDLESAVREIARVMRPDATFAAAIVHPINSAGTFDSGESDAVFRMAAYLDEWTYADAVERDGLRMTFTSRHRPLQAYFEALAAAGLTVDRLVEVPDTTAPEGSRWRRIPLFLHLRARLAQGAHTGQPE
jgi:SAM-dependent methyltransferase